MEIHIFDTEDVELKLSELRDLMHILESSVLGLESLRALDKPMIGGLLTVIGIARDKITALESSRQCITASWNEDQTLVLIGLNENQQR